MNRTFGKSTESDNSNIQIDDLSAHHHQYRRILFLTRDSLARCLRTCIWIIQCKGEREKREREILRKYEH